MHTHKLPSKSCSPRRSKKASVFVFLFHWYISIESLGGHKFHFLFSLIYYLCLFSPFGTCYVKWKRQRDGIHWPGLWIFILLSVLFSPFLIYFCAKYPVNTLCKAMVVLKQALKLMFWFSVKKDEIHVGWSGTRCAFETLEFYCDFFLSPSCLFTETIRDGAWYMCHDWFNLS